MEKKIKPIISYWKTTDPFLKLNILSQRLTHINIITTKTLHDGFIEFCLTNKKRIFLHIVINGMGKTQLEPKIQSVKESFFQIKKLIDSGFPQNQILVIIDPILPNDNGLNALKLLLRVFTEFKPLRLRSVRFNVLHYIEIPDQTNKFTIANLNIAKRPSTKLIGTYLVKTSTFFKDYYKLISDYSAIINVDKGEEALIGIRELLPFGYKNEWISEENGLVTREKLISYENNNRYKPIVNLISESNPVRCSNRCLLCPNRY